VNREPTHPRNARRVAVLVTGTRADSHDVAYDVRIQLMAIEALNPNADFGVLLHGHCLTGADARAHEFCDGREGWYVWPLPYFRDRGKEGGPKRNLCLVALLAVLRLFGFACYVLAFPDDASRGTRQCLKAAESEGFTVDVTEMGPRA
jgi:hypothetical protein